MSYGIFRPYPRQYPDPQRWPSSVAAAPTPSAVFRKQGARIPPELFDERIPTPRPQPFVYSATHNSMTPFTGRGTIEHLSRLPRYDPPSPQPFAFTSPPAPATSMTPFTGKGTINRLSYPRWEMPPKAQPPVFTVAPAPAQSFPPYTGKGTIPRLSYPPWAAPPRPQPFIYTATHDSLVPFLGKGSIPRLSYPPWVMPPKPQPFIYTLFVGTPFYIVQPDSIVWIGYDNRGQLAFMDIDGDPADPEWSVRADTVAWLSNRARLVFKRGLA